MTLQTPVRNSEIRAVGIRGGHNRNIRAGSFEQGSVKWTTQINKIKSRKR